MGTFSLITLPFVKADLTKETIVAKTGLKRVAIIFMNKLYNTEQALMV
jgi:hypothetical protein